jgi:hypothetical protein
MLEVSLDAAEWTAPSLIEAVRGFLFDNEEVEASIPLASPFGKGEESTGSPSPTGEGSIGCADHPAPPSPKGNSGGSIDQSREFRDD